MNKKIFIANDHAGFSLKTFLKNNNPEQNWEDLGVFNEEKSDYPDQAKKLCQALLKEPESLGVLVCASGQGMAIQANRFKGIRAALAWSIETSQLSREHNKANVLCLGAKLIPCQTADQIFKTFMTANFKEGRHIQRVKKLDSI